MHPFHEYLCQQLNDMLKKRRVVVFYDPRREFSPFIDRELKEAGRGHGDLPRVFLGENLTFLARHAGSFFGLRALVEPIAAQDNPDPLIVYLPGVARDHEGSVLMELEKAGACYEPQLRRLALNVLRKKFTDGQIDEMLKPAAVTYDDVVAFLQQGGGGEPASLLRTLFRGAQSEELIACWIGDQDRDIGIAAKDASPELFKLIETRLGLPLPADASLSEARERTMRYALVAEFRSDLGCELPPSASRIAVPASKDCVDRVRDVLDRVRKHYPSFYAEISDRVASDLNLEQAEIDSSCFGRIDTFRFEEKRRLVHAGGLLASRRYQDALDIVANSGRSFWVGMDIGRQAQWEACRLMAELGQRIEQVRSDLAKIGTDPRAWVAAYTTEQGWYLADALQRRLETWVAKMDEEPEDEKGLAVVRSEHEELLKRMAEGFSKALGGAGWTVQGFLHQPQVYPEVVQTMAGRTAYFMVDGLRFEMGVELAGQLRAAKDLLVRPAIASIPSITPVGMAALLPGASASFTVAEHKGALASRIEGKVLAGVIDRDKFLKAKIPDAADITLGKLLGTSSCKLNKLLGEASLIVVRSQEVDSLGEGDADLLARQVMDTVIGNLARAVKKLAGMGIENFVITGDHGHQFAARKDEDMRTDNPGGETLEVHRRVWIGRGGVTPPGTVRLTGAEMGYDTDLDFIFPTGLGVFKSGGGLSFHHGAFSLQELVIPVLSLKMPIAATTSSREKIVSLMDVPSQVTNRTFGVRIQHVLSLFGGAEVIALRVVLVSGSEEVGETGMVIGAEFDRLSRVIHLTRDGAASVGLMLTRDSCASLRVVVQDPITDAVLTQSDEIPVRLGI